MHPRKKLRTMVSLSKKRWKGNGFDLDLTYITNKIIAFGFPTEGHESVFRNPMPECQRFFETMHKDHYFVYNLCIEKERQYKASKFQERVAKFQWPDHNAPPLGMIEEFCEHATRWLSDSPENVVAIHCKAGKGRTGLMICCLLMYLNICSSADEAIQFYGDQRTYNGKGVTIPSQLRYIHYFEKVLQNRINLHIPFEPRFLKTITLHSISHFSDTKFRVMVDSNGVIQKRKDLQYHQDGDILTINLSSVPICGHTKLIINHPEHKKVSICWMWFHTIFIQNELILTKDEIDGAKADKENKLFPPDFSITLTFHPPQEKVEVKKEDEGLREMRILVHSQTVRSTDSIRDLDVENENEEGEGEIHEEEDDDEEAVPFDQLCDHHWNIPKHENNNNNSNNEEVDNNAPSLRIANSQVRVPFIGTNR